MYTDTTDEADYSGSTAEFTAAVTAAFTAAVTAAEARADYINSGYDESYAARAEVTQSIFEDLRDQALAMRGTQRDKDSFAHVNRHINDGDKDAVIYFLDRWVGQTQPWVVKTYELTQEIEDTRNRLATLEKRRRTAVLTALNLGSSDHQIAAVLDCDEEDVQEWIS